MNLRRTHSKQPLASMPHTLAVVLIIFLITVLPVQASGLQDVVPPTPTTTPSAAVSPTLPVNDSDLSWLSTPKDASALASSDTLSLLAGELIFHDLVDASSCPGYGLLKSGAANPCGEEKARNAVILWQNQFDEAIYNAAVQNGIPPFVLKNVIYYESQFWPANYPTPYGYSEVGLGHVTQMGADTLLRWNDDFYKEFCRTVYDDGTCKTSFAWLEPEYQAVLRGAVLQVLNADCGNCKGSVDIKRARASIPVIAAVLRANYSYTIWSLKGFTNQKPEKVYEGVDLWRLTLAGYNAGPGCLSNALRQTRAANEKIRWKTVSDRFDKTCAGTIPYVHNVTQVHRANPSALASAANDQSSAANLVRLGLGIAPTPIPTQVLPTATAVPASVTPSQTPPTPVATLTGTASAETSTPVPSEELTTTSTAITETAVQGTSSVTSTPLPDETVTASETPVEGTPSVSSTPLPDETVTASETDVPGTPSATSPPPATTASVTETVIQGTATSTPLPEQPTPLPDPAVSGEVVVKFNGLVPAFLAEAVIRSVGGEVQNQVDSLGLTVISAPEEKIPAIIEALQDNLLVDYAEPNYVVAALYTPEDPGYAGQGYLLDMQVPEAWDVTKGQDVIVAVIDTGVDSIHPDLTQSIWFNAGELGPDANGIDKNTNGVDDDGDGYIDNWQGWNFVNTTPDISDLNGHGTHSAGIIAAQMDNGIGLAGIAPLAKIMPLKALDETGHGSYIHVAEAIHYAVDHGAKIINLGFGGSAGSEVLLEATNYAFEHNVLVIAAAGNTGTNAVFYPAANPHVIAVSALDPTLSPAPFSTYGDAVSLSAPGVGIYSTLPGGQFGQMNGTSMSAAEVSGIAALLASQPRFDTPDKLANALSSTARDLGDPGRDDHFGSGLVQAYHALGFAPDNPTATPTVDVTATVTAEISPTPGADVSILADAPNSSLGSYTASCSTTTYNSQLPLGTSVNITGNNNVSGAINLPFEFWYLGGRYAQVYVSSNGWLSFSNPGVNSYLTNNLGTGGNTAGQIARPMLAPLWDDLNQNQAGTSARYSSGIDAAGNPTFIMEWWNYQWSTGTGRISFRVVLHANTGIIDYLYFNNNAGAITGASASIGLTASGTGIATTPPAFKRVTDVTCFASPWTDDGTVADPANLATRPASGTIYTFTPPQTTVNTPTGLYLTNVDTSATTVTINWTDNSTNEDAFAIYRSTDGTTWTSVANVNPNTETYNVAGLTVGTDYYWRVYAVTEGVVSPVAILNPPASLNFSNVGPTSMQLNWSNVSNETGYLVYRSTDGITFARIAQTDADVTTYTASGLTSSTRYYWRIHAVGAGTLTSPVRGNQATPFISTQPPIVTISSPANGSSFVEGRMVDFSGTAIIPTNGDISQFLSWSLDGTTIIGTGSSFSLSDIAPGLHVISATVTDDFGRSAHDTISITITANPSPHGNFNGSTSQCAVCHRGHSAQQSPWLVASPLTSNESCLSCHSNDGVIVSTHSNKDWIADGYPNPRTEGAFEVLCVQCHNPHGDNNNSNLNHVRDFVWLDDAPLPSGDPEATDTYPSNGPVVFNSLSGNNSFDDNGASGSTPSNRICTTCHASDFPGISLEYHDGGANHGGIGINYSGLDCTQCHSHSLDGSFTTNDGFSTGCRACHSTAQSRTTAEGTRRQIVSNPILAGTGGDFNRASHHVNDSITDADCLVCHEMSQHQQGKVRLLNVDAPATVYTLDYTFAPTVPTEADARQYESFCRSCHDANGKDGDTTPFSDGKTVPSLSSLWSSARHNITNTSFLGSCIDCHDNGHGSNKAKLLAPWNYVAGVSPDPMQQEETFCFKCHTTAPGLPVFSAFSSYFNTGTRIFKHDVSGEWGLDHSKEVLSTKFGNLNRHAECGDCHESHEDAYPNTATAPAVKLSQRGATGVEPAYNGSGAPVSFDFLTPVTNEYQVCFKCHSSYTNLPNYLPDGWRTNGGGTFVANGLRKLTTPSSIPDSRDLALAFNPSNQSFHPVMAVGKNPDAPAAGFVSGWSSSSRVYCTSCHTNATPASGGQGPHGSPLLHILDGSAAGASNYTTVIGTIRNGDAQVPNTELCFKCHDYATYVTSVGNASGTRFREGDQTNLHAMHMSGTFTRASCYTCHNTHGSGQMHLINFDVSVAVPQGGRTSETAWVSEENANPTVTGTCYVACHSMAHDASESYSP